MGRKTLETLIPDEILQNSLFIGGFYDLARNVETLTEARENVDGRRFFLKKGGGQVIDLATTPSGLPITLWSALISDGCGVASWTLKTAAKSCESDEDLLLGRLLGVTAGEIDHIGELSKNVNRFFDTPGKEEAKALLESSAGLLKYTKENSELLGEDLIANVEGLHQLTKKMTEKIGDQDVQAEFIEKTTGLTEALCNTTGALGSDLKTFITAPNKKNFIVLSLGLEKSFKKAPVFFYKETTRTLCRFPEYVKYLPRADKEILAVAKIIRGLSSETDRKMVRYIEHYKGALDEGLIRLKK